MAAAVSRKLTNSFEGALAGGGDPATSPLYVFGPFLKLIAVGMVAQVTFGASIWLVIFTVASVSAMYRMVMAWVTDGSGGSGLSEEEFGGWAVKINAAITFIEYTLTFLVSMAAMVTFIADRLPVLNHAIVGIQYRTFVAIALSILTGWLVNRGPKVSARAFGPATAAVLVLLWAMIGASIWHRFAPGGALAGVPLLPNFDLNAFKSEYLFEYTLAGYARILALMTGIEVFANLVAAYEGDPVEKSRKAFGSLMIIMGSTAATMLVVGPAIRALSDLHLAGEVSVFTQTMDALLPAPLPQLGTLIGVAVLLSASAASAQGLQNLALGLTRRHYVPAFIGQRNRFDVAPAPVWIEVGLVVIIFLLAGTNEETYLAVYAAGVFILLSMTGWAATKRLTRQLQLDFRTSKLLTLLGTIFAAVLTTGATFIIFDERFFEGAWLYIPMVAGLYVVFSYFRNRLGHPSELEEELGRIVETMPGLGVPPVVPDSPPTFQWTDDMKPLPVEDTTWSGQSATVRRIMVSLDGSEFAERALPLARAICRTVGASMIIVSVLPIKRTMQVLSSTDKEDEKATAGHLERQTYLREVTERMSASGVDASYIVAAGPVAESINQLMQDTNSDLLAMSTHGLSGLSRFLMGSTADAIVQLNTKPVLLIRPEKLAEGQVPDFDKILLPLDGSHFSERILPYAKAVADAVDGEMILLRVPDVPQARMYSARSEAITELRKQAEKMAWRYLKGVAADLREDGSNVRSIVIGNRPAQTIVEVSETEHADLIMLATHGRGGMDRVFVGSVADRVIHHARCPVFLVPIRERRTQV